MAELIAAAPALAIAALFALAVVVWWLWLHGNGRR